MADVIVLTILGLAVFFVFRYRWKSGKAQGSCCGCGGNEDACNRCKKEKGK